MIGPDEHAEAKATGPSVGDIFSDLFRAMTGLIRSEIRLARAELAEAGQQVAQGLELMASGAVLLIVALFAFVQASVIALAFYVGPLWASVIVGAVLALMGLILILIGRRKVSAARLIPEKSLDQTSRDIRLAKEQI